MGKNNMGKTILEKANIYVDNNKDLTDKRFRQSFHIMPPIGWMNDPNGLCYALGKYHVFFQFHPYSAAWGPMHWGHYTSENLLEWKWEGVAIAPDEGYDSFGCFSGSAIEHNNKMYLMYTGVTTKTQEQVLVSSDDGVNFHKHGIVIDHTKLPECAIVGEFRDPKIFKRGDRFYAVVGSKTDKYGIVVLFKSDDLVNWDSCGIIWQDTDNIGVCECPDLVRVNGYDVLFYCISKKADSSTSKQENKFVIGHFDEERGIFKAESQGKVDYGDAFYAAQSMQTKDGRNILFAWLNDWSKELHNAKYGWIGSLTFPRTLEVKDGELIQFPIEELKELYDSEHSVTAENISVIGNKTLDGVGGTAYCLELSMDYKSANGFGIKLLESEKPALDLYCDKINGEISVYSTPENKKYGCRYCAESGVINLHILADKTSVEIFVDNGKRALTFNIPAEYAGDGIEFYTVHGESIIEKLVFNPIRSIQKQ